MQNGEVMELATGLENSRVKAMVDADVNTLDKLLCEELYYGHTGGYIDTKASFLEKISTGVYSYKAIKTQVDEATVIGESALVLNGQLTIEVNAAGENKVFHAIYLGVWKMEGVTWRFLSLQAAFKK